MPPDLPVGGAPHGTRRIRVGPYRVIYRVDDDNYIVNIGYIVTRGDTTYRRGYARFS